MFPRQRPPTELLRLAELQAGILTTEQIAGLGLGRTPTARLLGPDHGWQRVAPGLYLVSGDAPSWEGLAWGGVLLGGPGSRLGGAAAGYLWGLNHQPTEIDVLTPLKRQLRSRPPWRFVREAPGLRRPSQGSPARIGLEDTVLDRCAELEEDGVIGLVTRAIQSRRTTAARLRHRLDARDRVRHRRLLTALLADVREGAESPLELAYLRDVERAHGLPRGRRQHRSGPHVRDVFYDEFAVVVELDGRMGHEGSNRFRDMERDNVALLRGEVTLRYGWSDVHGRCCSAAWQVGSVLVQRGWSGIPHRCARCVAVPIEELGVA